MTEPAEDIVDAPEFLDENPMGHLAPMTLEAFIAEQKAALDRFATWYANEAANAPEDQEWPLEQGEGEWFEQLVDFQTSGRDADGT